LPNFAFLKGKTQYSSLTNLPLSRKLKSVAVCDFFVPVSIRKEMVLQAATPILTGILRSQAQLCQFFLDPGISRGGSELIPASAPNGVRR